MSQRVTEVTELSELFSEQDLAVVRRAASEVVTAVVHGQTADPSQTLGDLATRPISGIYVTLKRGQTLRGCCGLQGPPVELAGALVDAATRTAKHDPRMSPIAAVELPFLSLSVSILGPPRPIGVAGDARVDAVQVGRHGLRIRMGNNVGLLLPVVAAERGWNSRQFLDAVCTKAGLPPGSWRSDNADVQIFDGVDQGGQLVVDANTAAADCSLYDRSELQNLCEWVRYNLVATHTGATPFYYATSVSDKTVQGVVLRVTYDANQPPVSWMQLTIRDGFPLQSTLFQMTQTAAQALASQGPADQWRADVAVLSSVVHHGSDSDCDLGGIDTGRRAVVAMDGRRWAIGFDTASQPEPLLQTTLQAQSFRSNMTQIYSAICDSSASAFEVSLGPQPNATVSARAPGVAGAFYPADDHDRDQMVGRLLSGMESNPRKHVAAAMVPHAGLRFSGSVAADVWSRIEMPETVLIIGPKHTADGVDWAVAPHDVWQLSDQTSMPGNVELANRIAEEVPGMELDSRAHAREHGIEVQLPILHQLAPNTKITAIAMSGASFDELQQTAQSLATCLSKLDKPPLLVISSDMNHFADDEENRRRDRIALDALANLDAQRLLKVCEDESISMCGQVPAALVLWTLQAMNQKVKFEEIAYATSADVSGDRSRVVGYAGVLLS